MRFSSIPFLAAVTPSGGGGGGSLTIVQSPAKASQGYGLTVQQTLSAVTSGNHLIVAVWGWTSGGVPAISDSAGGSWSAAVHSVTTAVGDMSIYFFIRANVTSGLTWVRATYAGAAECYIAATEVSGGTPSLDGTAGDATQSSATQWDHAFTSTSSSVLFVGVASLGDSQTATGVAPVTAECTAEWTVYSRGIFPTAGSNTATFNLAATRSGHKSWIVVKGG